MGLDHKNEVSPFVDGVASEFAGDEFMAIDIANINEKIAVEFDGPSHFLGFKGTGRDPNGKTKMKLRLLKILGWKVVNIPWFEWQEVNKGDIYKPEKIEYLKKKLAEVGHVV